MADLRHSLALGALLLAACSGGGAEGEGGEVPEGDTIPCATGGAASLAPECTVEREVVDGVLFLTLHHPDGGFRRLRVETDGSGVSAADGADMATITVYDGEIEVALGGDRYVLPATITGSNAGPDGQ